LTLTRRKFLGTAVAGLAGSVAGAAVLRAAPAWACADRAACTDTERYVIINADDFGESEGVNRGVIEGHARGVVTSASLIVTRARSAEAWALARQHPQLGVGLHVAFSRHGKWLIDLQDLHVVERELARQFDMFVDLTGQLPTHLDSHRHAHREFNVGRVFLELSERYQLPLRGLCRVRFVGAFYAQAREGQSELSRISAERLVALIQSAQPGFTEISCHPGYEDAENDETYNRERAVELRALTDPRVCAAAATCGVALVTYRDYQRLSTPAEAGPEATRQQP
jgi:predicted glycoside hydrolase/deacetylase ChbG (UPF0249 family)